MGNNFSNRFLNLRGHRFGRLMVLEYAGQDRCHHSLWRCRCICGKIVPRVSTTNLKTPKNNHSGRNSSSCGCYRGDMLRKRNTANAVHGQSEPPTTTYSTWRSIVTKARRHHLQNDWKKFTDFFLTFGAKPVRAKFVRRNSLLGFVEGNCYYKNSLRS